MDKLLSDSSLGIVTCEGLPLGIASKSFSRAAMDTVFKHYKTEKNDTGFIYFFTKTGLCAQGVVQPLHENHVLDEARLTLDYEEDFQVFNAIFEALYTEGQVFALADVVRYLRAHPEVMSRNLHVSEEYWRRTEEKAQLLYRNADGTVQNVLDS